MFLSAVVDGGEPGEPLGQLPQPVEGVEVGGLAVPGQGLGVELDPLHRLHTGLGAVTIIPVQSHSVTHEVTRILIQSKLLVDLVHGAGRAEVLPSLWILHVEVLGPNQEILKSSLFEKTHEVRAKSFPLIRRGLGDLSRFSQDI